ncbi:MAG: aldo/keto reductase [Pseudomonadales bacterium]
MINRRDFTRYSASVAIAASMPPVANSASHQRMSRRPIRGTDESLPVVGLGNSTSFFASDLSIARNLIDIFLEHGGGYIDLGGSSRINVGKIAREKNAADELFLGNYLDAKGLQETRSSAKALAKEQGKAMLDLANSRDLPNYRANTDQFRALKEEGLARYIGVARFGPHVIDTMVGLIEDELVDFVQINYSLIEPQAANHLLPLALDHDVAIIINRPFINGKFFDIVRGVKLPEWAIEFDCHSWAQFSLKFILANPAVNCVLTETANPKHAVDNLGAGFGRLPDTATQQRMLKLIQDLL